MFLYDQNYYLFPWSIPSRQRRRARRAAERETEAAEQAINKETDENAEKADAETAAEVVEADIDDATVPSPTVEVREENELIINDAEEADDNFHCDICDFKSNWGNGLRTHMTRKHASIEQTILKY